MTTIYSFEEFKSESGKYGGDFISITKTGFYVSSHLHRTIRSTHPQWSRWEDWSVDFEIDKEKKALMMKTVDINRGWKVKYGYGGAKLWQVLPVGRYKLIDVKNGQYIFTHDGNLKRK